MKKKIEEFIRDVTQVTPRPKSEVRRRLNEIINQKLEKREKKLKKYIKKNYLHIRKCPDCSYESADNLKCQNTRCKSLSKYGSRHLLPTKEKADKLINLTPKGE